MTTQQVVFHKDTFQIHIEKEYHDGILIIENHYDIHGRFIYRNDDECEVKYFYDTDNVIYELSLSLHKQKNILRKLTPVNYIGKHYTMDIPSCTHLCTLNSSDAISYIKNYIKQYILKAHDL